MSEHLLILSMATCKGSPFQYTNNPLNVCPFTAFKWHMSVIKMDYRNTIGRHMYLKPTNMNNASWSMGCFSTPLTQFIHSSFTHSTIPCDFPLHSLLLFCVFICNVYSCYECFMFFFLFFFFCWICF